MSLISFKHSATSILLRVKILNSSLSTGAGLTGLTSASSGLIVSTITDNEASATAYTVAGGLIETITTLGTYAAPTATKCRFKEVDATNHPGVYEIQLADARFAIASAKSVLISVLGATNGAETDALVPLTQVDPYDAVRAGLTALPNAGANAAGGLPISSGGALDLDALNAAAVRLTTARAQVLDDWINAGRLDTILDTLNTSIGTAGAGLTDLGGMSTAMKGQVNTEVDGALNTAIPGSPTSGSVNEALKITLNSFVSGSVNDAGALIGDFNGDAGLSATDNFYNSLFLMFTGGVNKGIARKIASSNGTTKNLDFTGDNWVTVPANGDPFIILGRDPV